MAITDTQTIPDALYNRYRPRRLSDLVGQTHVTVPLRRAFDSGRIHHAYLLSGPRGCGKTSTARILAAGLVCENGPTADPCNECDLCQSVIRGNALDVIEMDAATNGRVDDARELREKAHFSPAIARFKVVIIDEAHMVTKEGFNALLKLIEEPPPHLRFIFATTDPDKVLPTIRSRTYHYSFRLVPAPDLAAHLETVVAKESGTLEDGVLGLVLRAGGGSMRDSLAVLGQLLDGSEGGRVKLDEAAALLGATSETVLDETVTALAERNMAALLGAVGRAVDAGVDPRRLAEDLLDRLRDLLLLATTGVLPPLAEIAGADRQAGWRETVQRLGVGGLTTACEVLQAATASMHSGQPRITLEVACSRILLNLNTSPDAVAGELAALSQQVAALASGHVVRPPATPPAPAAGATTTSEVASSAPALAVGIETPASIVPSAPKTGAGGEMWGRLLESVKGRRKVTWMLLDTQTQPVTVADGRIALRIAPAAAGSFRSGGHTEVVADAAAAVFGGVWTVELHEAA